MRGYHKEQLGRIVDYLYSRAQKAPSEREFQSLTLAIRIVGLARRDLPCTLDHACFQAFGIRFSKYHQCRLEQDSQKRLELARIIPDFDPEEAHRAHVEQAARIRGQSKGGGTVYAWPEARKERSTEQEPVRDVPGETTDLKPGRAPF